MAESGTNALRELAERAPSCHEELVSVLAAGPEPERAIGRAERILAESRATPDGTEQAAAFVHALAATCATAPFLATWLTRNPSWLSALAAEDYAAPRSPEPKQRVGCGTSCSSCVAVWSDRRTSRVTWTSSTSIPNPSLGPTSIPMENEGELRLALMESRVLFERYQKAVNFLGQLSVL